MKICRCCYSEVYLFSLFFNIYLFLALCLQSFFKQPRSSQTLCLLNFFAEIFIYITIFTYPVILPWPLFLQVRPWFRTCKSLLIYFVFFFSRKIFNSPLVFVHSVVFYDFRADFYLFSAITFLHCLVCGK